MNRKETWKAAWSDSDEDFEVEIRKPLFFIRSETKKSQPKLRLFISRKGKMAGVERFELPTRGFGIRCSANWSYTP
ncbi:hypothetical protein, partial [Vibrio alginolyticus]|uniref:hypothetical protein n=1 Tax=Vibrio alginolyticus TaxID=663 RepID=UPI00384F7734